MARPERGIPKEVSAARQHKACHVVLVVSPDRRYGLEPGMRNIVEFINSTSHMAIMT
jgi:hypothetical protein